MRSKIGVVFRIGLMLGVIFLVVSLNVNVKQGSLLAQTKGSGDRSAQQKPWKPAGAMSLIVGAGGGTAYDFLARQVAQVLPDFLGKPLIVNISPGGGGGNALDMLRMAKPDGRTFALYGLGTQVALTLEKRYKWDIKDLRLILAIDAPPYAVLASAKHSNYKNFNDLMKAKGEVRIATAGANFSIVPLLLELEKNGVKYRAARFKGTSESNLAVIAGDADITIVALSSIALDPIRAGDFQPLWIFANRRNADLPEVPTHIELGMPREWSSYNIIRLFALPPAVPADIQNVLSEALTKSLQDKRSIEWSKKAEIPLDLVQPKELEERVRIVQEGFKSNIELVRRYFF